MPLIKPQTTYLKDYQPPSFLVTSIEVEVDIEDKWAVVSSKIKAELNNFLELKLAAYFFLNSKLC